MSFENRNEYITAQSSEKAVLAWTHATTRLIEWTLEAGAVYRKIVPYFVYQLKQLTVELTRVDTLGAVVEGSFYYDIHTSIVYVWTNGSTNPTTDEEMICTYRFFYSNTPITASWDLSNTSDHVQYDPRIIRSPGYKHKIAVEQDLISTVGSGTLRLENNDGGLDDIFDTVFFENQVVEIYSWNRQLQFEDSQIVYKGRIQNKNFNTKAVWFVIKDQIHDLLQNVPQDAYTDADNVNSDIKGRYKRWIYGRVAGLKLQSLDQIGEGYLITGTVSGDPTTLVVTGTTTTFLAELSPGDKLTVESQEFEIESVESDTSATITDLPEYAFTNQPGSLSPEIPTVTKNREFLVSGHACTELSKTVVDVIQFNRVQLSDVIGLEAGDFLEFSTGERVEIKNTAPGDIVVLRQNLILIPSVSSTVIRQPVQRVFVEGKSVEAEDFTITNIGAPTNSCQVTLDSDVEFRLSRASSISIDMTFTNGTRDITTVEVVDLRDTFSPRDWIRPADLTYSTYYEVLSVEEQSIKIRTSFVDPTITDTITAKFPNYIGDETVISADILGRTEDGEPSGVWIRTGAQAVRDLVESIGITDYFAPSFDEAELDNKALISVAVPSSPAGSQETVKSVADKINLSINAALTLGPNLKLRYRVLNPQIIEDDLLEISDRDVIDWSVRTTNGKTYGNSLARYRHADVDRATLDAGNLALTYESEFVQNYIGTNQGSEIDLYLYNDNEANIALHRHIYYNSLGRTDITLETDLRLEAVKIGDQIQINFDRLYKRLGDKSSRKKICMVVGRTVTGTKIKLDLTDLGNIYNRSSIITPNTAPDWSAASEDEKIKYGYITDDNGLIDNDEDTGNIHLIS